MKKIGIIFLVVFWLAGCSSDHIAFTQKIRSHYQLGSEELKKLQFYISDEVAFKKSMQSPELYVIQKGKLYTKEQAILDEVIVKKHTPGIAVGEFFSDYELAISFEEGADLPFKATAQNGYYHLKRIGDDNRAMQLNYQGQSYGLANLTAQPYLLISQEALKKLVEHKKVLAGREVE